MKDNIPMAHRASPLPNNPSFAPRLLSIPDNVSTELLIYGQSKPDVISLAQGDGHLTTPSYICDAAHQAMIEGKTHYGPVLGQPVLRQALSTYYQNIFNVDVHSERIYVTSSGTTALHYALNSVIQEGDEVVCITPIWRNIMGIVSLAGGKSVQVPLDYDHDNGWDLDLDKLFDACTERTKAILVVTPSNPTGWVMNHEQMQAVIDFCRERGLWIIADSVYNRLKYGQKTAPDFLELTNEDDLIYSVNSFSKTWAMTGWRLGWLVGPKISQPAIQNLTLYENMGAPAFVQYGGVTALQQGEEFIQKQMTLWESNLDIICDRFSQNVKIDFVRPDAAFYTFFRVKGEKDCVNLCRRLIDDVGLSIAPGRSFGAAFAGWIRMSYAVSEKDLIEALDRLERLVK